MGHHDTALRAPMGRAKGGAMRDVGEGQCAAPGQLGLGASAPTAQPGSPRAALRFTCLIVGEAGQIARLDILDHTLELVWFLFGAVLKPYAQPVDDADNNPPRTRNIGAFHLEALKRIDPQEGFEVLDTRFLGRVQRKLVRVRSQATIDVHVYR